MIKEGPLAYRFHEEEEERWCCESNFCVPLTQSLFSVETPKMDGDISWVALNARAYNLFIMLGTGA